MSFQLVRASDTGIAVWETEQGHVFVFEVSPEADGLTLIHTRAAPDATRPVAEFAADALAFATVEARSRLLIRLPPESRGTRQARPGAA
ncbi:hypothetical protein [Lichenifustis flavocetrariae]|uniref:Uncharacterized protein n=1 Tax=Lichenifustis flavocetrariae TaxID=2949735 RepID=A0AA42CI17_9HYPH|nr:hypothetical protein [Lichenifustis flavocetrariae]MCW6507879.1 hypothetical protein [Lichenifustis flavocetrariae]